MKNQTHFLLFDAARATETNLNTASEYNPDVVSLYQGRAEENLAVVGPYLFAFPQSKDFSDFFLQYGWGNSWGLVFTALVKMNEAVQHFQKFLLVKTEDGQELYFRFYDPRVMRIFLPTCDEQQLKDLFGPVTSFTMEDEDPAFALEFSLIGGKLNTSRIPFEQFKSNFGLPMPEKIKMEIQEAPVTEVVADLQHEQPAIQGEEKKSKWKTF